MTLTPNYETISEIRAANERAGMHFFERAAMRFFASKVEGSQVFGGRYFITSEQFRPSSGPAAPRRFTIREARTSGDVFTIGEFQAFYSAAEARAVARHLAEIITAGRLPILGANVYEKGERVCPECRAELEKGALECPACGVDSYAEPAPEATAQVVTN